MHSPIRFWTLLPEPFEALRTISAYLHKSTLGDPLVELVFMRASQLNGCASCLDMHVRALRKLGERQQRLDVLAAWREAPFFSERERAALAWTEAMTKLADHPVPDEIHELARRSFSEKELAELTFAVAAINAWNRLYVGLSLPPAEHAAP